MTALPLPPDQRAGRQGDLPDQEVTIDAAVMTTREINRSLRALAYGTAVVVNPGGRHNLAVGLDAPLRVEIEGSAGFYAGGLGKSAGVTVHGAAGCGAGENLMSGRVHVRGPAGPSAASSARGGVIVVDEDCSARAGISLKGATLAIGGNAGPFCGVLAQSGVILVGGDAGPGLGDALYQAVIYVGGRIAGLGGDAVIQEMTERDVRFVKVIAEECGFGHVSPGNVTKVVSTRRLYQLHSPHHGAYS
ncbi:glutamate synthase [Sphaerisporangium album]|uniref:Glutamate synthase n=1 Tax=Sphaerisporangium album TaxID=509200 RepID=A0A367FD55_9ACTN|nr:glutamate synthase [Sphaerisporangium album]RCG28313.1 glutamate synthase [Sphaerisporangium album]